MRPKAKLFWPAFALSFAADMASKLWIDASLTFADRIPVIDGFFYITHVRNPGAAFGLFNTAPATLRLTAFIGITLVAIAMIFSFYRKLAPGERLSALSLGLILGGASGNLVDRVFRGEVVDFLHFRLWGGYQWPDFNLADSFIVVGVALLVIELLASEGETRTDPAGEGAGPDRALTPQHRD
ncbi:MAG: signal peptidase II [Deltaproteobacteria bacterium]|nr:signal peptidase II [Deltaproteobacteria bacterium]